jgi:hypothetical protein
MAASIGRRRGPNGILLPCGNLLPHAASVNRLLSVASRIFLSRIGPRAFKLGAIARARADFDRAVKWHRDHSKLRQPGWSQELDSFQAEAKALLDGPPPELPADVFAPDHP